MPLHQGDQGLGGDPAPAVGQVAGGQHLHHWTEAVEASALQVDCHATAKVLQLEGGGGFGGGTEKNSVV